MGSYPKPKSIYPKSGRSLLDSVGISFDVYSKKTPQREVIKKLNIACLQAITDQNNASIDIITDGEERRGHYVLYVLKKLAGFDFKNLKRVSIRGGIYQRDVPVIRSAIRYKSPMLVRDFRFTKKLASGYAKVGLPGPSTVIDCVADEYYGDVEKIAFDYAQAIHNEVGELIKAGCSVIQFDDPVLLRYPERAKKWGLKALEKCFEGFEKQATFIVHICCGYPNIPLEKKGITYKANKDYYKDILSWLSKSKLDVVSIEAAQSNLDLSVLSAIGKKTVMLGVIDVGQNRVETVDSIITRANEALQYISPRQLILAPDCGMLELTRSSAKKKLTHMSLAALKINTNTE